MKIFNKYKLIASIIYLTSPMYNAYANTPLASIPESFQILTHSISLDLLALLHRSAIYNGPEFANMINAEALELLQTSNFNTMHNTLLAYLFNVKFAYDSRIEALKNLGGSTRSFRQPIQPISDSQNETYDDIIERLKDFASALVGSDESRTAVINYRLRDLKALLNDAAAFMISMSTESNHVVANNLRTKPERTVVIGGAIQAGSVIITGNGNICN